MLARDRIVFLERQLLGLGAGVLAGDIEIAGVGGREQLDLERGGLSHGRCVLHETARRTRQEAREIAGQVGRQNSEPGREVKPVRRVAGQTPTWTREGRRGSTLRGRARLLTKEILMQV